MAKKKKIVKKQVEKEIIKKEVLRPKKSSNIIFWGLLFVIIIIAAVIFSQNTRIREVPPLTIREEITPATSNFDVVCYSYNDGVLAAEPINVEISLKENDIIYTIKQYNNKLILRRIIVDFSIDIDEAVNCRAGINTLGLHVLKAEVPYKEGNQVIESTFTCGYSGDTKDRKDSNVIADEIEQAFKTCIKNHDGG